jgi:hypothetical protein
MGQADTITARRALATDLHHVGVLYAQKAQTLYGIASKMNQMHSSEVTEYSLTQAEALDRAHDAAMCANFVATAVQRLQTGDYDWEFLRLLNEFTATDVVPTDATEPSAS